MLNLVKAYLGLRTVSSPICQGERREKWLKDLDFIEKELPKRHKNLFFDSCPENFYHQLNDIKAHIDLYTDDKIKVALAALVASIKDGHSILCMKPKSI